MAVFDGSIKTPRRIANPITDQRISSVASLMLPAIHTPSALVHPGSDVSIVHGHQQLHVDQNRLMHVGMNQDVTVRMHETYQVDMNRTMTVMQNYTRSVMMNSAIMVTGNYSKNVLANYAKNVTGSSTNSIMGSYWKTVTGNYSKSVTGNADNAITGHYSKTVQATYTKTVTETCTTTVTGDYIKTLQANYSKTVTGTSAVTVTGTSNENYTGDHSRLYSRHHRTYIVGNDCQTTLGSTLCTNVGPKIFGQSGAHQQQHDDASQEDRESWFKHTWKDGLLVGEKMELAGQSQGYTVHKMEFVVSSLEGTVALLEFGSLAQAYKISAHRGHIIENEEKVAHEKAVAIDEKIAALNTSLSSLKSDTAAMHEEIGAVAERIQPVNLFVGVLFGGNQFAM